MSTDKTKTTIADYDTWRGALGLLIIARLGCDLDDLPDQPTRDYFDQGMTIVEAAAEIMERLKDDGYMDSDYENDDTDEDFYE